MEKLRICKICGKEFISDKYHSRQEVCLGPSCQHKRQLLNQKQWRKDNPDYFKYKDKKNLWEQKRAQYLKNWRQSHKNYKKFFAERENKR